MKKLFSILAVFILTLTCGVLLSACGGDNNPNNRKGEKCYVDVVDYNTHEKYGKELYFEYGTNFNGISNWMGTDDNSDRYWFIKGDVVNFKVYNNSMYYYFAPDFKLIINGEPVDMVEKRGYFLGDVNSGREVTYFEGNYTIQSNITVDCTGVIERTANITLKATTDDELWEKYLNSLGPDEDPKVSKAEYIQEQKRDYYDDSVKIRFADKDTFGLEKDTWGISELRNYIIENEVTGEVGVASGTDIYVFSEGFTQKVSTGFNDNRMMDSTILSDRYCYVNDQANEYGYKTTLRSFTTENTDENGANKFTDDVKFKDGYVMLQMNKERVEPVIFGCIEELDYVGYKFSASINEVRSSNSIFSIKYGNSAYGEELKMSDFNADGTLNVQIKLNKYSNASWKNVYNRMKIKISDRYLDFTISPSGIINLVLDMPYKYCDLAIHGDVPESFTGEILDEYMYTYYWQFDVIELAKNAGLLLEVAHPYYTPNLLKITFGTISYDASNSYGFYEKIIARVINEDDSIVKALLAKGEDMVGFIQEQDVGSYSKAVITTQNNTTFEINVVSKNATNSNYIDFDEIYGLLGELNYQQGKEAAILKMVYTYTNEEGNEVHYYAYTIKMLSDLKVKSIRFYN